AGEHGHGLQRPSAGLPDRGPSPGRAPVRVSGRGQRSSGLSDLPARDGLTNKQSGVRVVRIMEGVRVLEVAAWTYVPAAGAVLAEWGADVIKIEHPDTGDPQ